eukprot:1162136-Pelagomonas_calceolata.AAC.8
MQGWQCLGAQGREKSPAARAFHVHAAALCGASVGAHCVCACAAAGAAGAAAGLSQPQALQATHASAEEVCGMRWRCSAAATRCERPGVACSWREACSWCERKRS